MTAWTNDELSKIGAADELHIQTRRRDGTLRNPITIWVVHQGDDLYVRSAYGPSNPWYRRAMASGSGRIRAGGVERDVSFAEAPPDAQAAIDAAYHTKYDRYGERIVGTVVGPQAQHVTIRLVPASLQDQGIRAGAHHGHEPDRPNESGGIPT